MSQFLMDQQNDKKTILIVDDTETNIDMMVAILKDYDTIAVLSANEAFLVLEEEKVDLILLDIVMPDIDGFEACQKIKTNLTTKDIPIIFITSKADEESIEKAYEIGGNDYVTKPFRPRELKARVKIQLEFHRLVDHLKYIASHDPLTGVLNRREFFNLASKMFESTQPLCAAMVDIDKFKSINDQFGHQVGDIVLKNITNHINSATKNAIGQKWHTDKKEELIFARIGGEEFCILGKSIEIDEFLNFIDNLRDEISQIGLTIDANENENENEKTTIFCSISCGIAHRKTMYDYKTLDSLLDKADGALYEAKNKGRNRTIFRG